MKKLLFLAAATLFLVFSPNNLHAQKRVQLASTNLAQFEADVANILTWMCDGYPNTGSALFNNTDTEAYVGCVNVDTLEVVNDVIYYYIPFGSDTGFLVPDTSYMTHPHRDANGPSRAVRFSLSPSNIHKAAKEST